MPSSHFSYNLDTLQNLTQDVLQIARQIGATDAAAEFSEGNALSVTVRQGSVETIEQSRDKAMIITAYLGQQRGYASSSDFSLTALRDTVQAAFDIARFTAKDNYAGLPDVDSLEMHPRNLDLYHPWLIDAIQAGKMAQQIESAAFDVNSRITNSEGATVATHHGQFVMANTRGFMGGYPYSRHFISCAPIASQAGEMQRDDWYSSARSAKHLARPEMIGRYAAQRALARLAARSLKTQQAPILFEAPLAAGLLGSFVQAASGSALYRKASFLVDALGEKIFADHITIKEDPSLPDAYGSAPFDEEGVKVTQRNVVQKGILEGYFLSTYSARKLGMKTTGNAGGSHNLFLMSDHTTRHDNLEAMLKKLDTGLFVTELMGHGINYVTGDYSRGAFGYWVEKGEICYPVQEITIAGNLKKMWRDIAAIGADNIVRGTKNTGSVLIENMTIAGGK